MPAVATRRRSTQHRRPVGAGVVWPSPRRCSGRGSSERISNWVRSAEYVDLSAGAGGLDAGWTSGGRCPGRRNSMGRPTIGAQVALRRVLGRGHEPSLGDSRSLFVLGQLRAGPFRTIDEQPWFRWWERRGLSGVVLAMSVAVLCPNLRCKAVLSVPDAARGKMIRCGKCGTTLRVPPQKPAGAKPANPTAAEAAPGGPTNDSSQWA